MMMFSRLGRSTISFRSTISRSKNVFSGANGGRSTGSSVYQDINFLFSNPRIRRFFSSESQPPKNDENYKEKKGNNQESESKEESTTEGAKRPPLEMIFMMVFLSKSVISDLKGEQISYQEFKKKLLEPGLVDHIVFSNRLVAYVYVKNSQGNQTTTDNIVEGNSIDSPAKLKTGLHKYYFNIGSVNTFQKKLDEAQKALGIDTHDYVPVTYDYEMVSYHEIEQWVNGLIIVACPVVLFALLAIMK